MGRIVGNQDEAHNFRFSLLPFLEQQALFSCFDPKVSARKRVVGRPETNLASTPPELLGAIVPVYHCPTNPMEPVPQTATDPNYNTRVMAVDYTGIAGAFPDPAGRLVKQNGGGGVSNHGLLVINEWRGLEKAIDGTSNTFVVGEQSMPEHVVNNSVRNSPSNFNGGWFGAHTNLSGASSLSPGITIDDPVFTDDPAGGYQFWGTGVITARYPINYDMSKFTWAQVPGSWDAWRHNTLFMSHHPGGSQFCNGDGSARFVSQTIDLDQVLLPLCTADDGKSVSMP